ncbi:hypothetical protein Hanom_Chr13g01231821 [Helianthus anomalus]
MITFWGVTIGEVSKCFGKPISVLQDLKPRGLDEAVCKEVLGSLSKKAFLLRG